MKKLLCVYKRKLRELQRATRAIKHAPVECLDCGRKTMLSAWGFVRNYQALVPDSGGDYKWARPRVPDCGIKCPECNTEIRISQFPDRDAVADCIEVLGAKNLFVTVKDVYQKRPTYLNFDSFL